jgi:hypothetical protein
MKVLSIVLSELIDWLKAAVLVAFAVVIILIAVAIIDIIARFSSIPIEGLFFIAFMIGAFGFITRSLNE